MNKYLILIYILISLFAVYYINPVINLYDSIHNNFNEVIETIETIETTGSMS